MYDEKETSPPVVQKRERTKMREEHVITQLLSLDALILHTDKRKRHRALLVFFFSLLLLVVAHLCMILDH